MDILSPKDHTCLLCNTSFIPRDSRQKYCLACVHKPCPQCGAKKDTRAKLCKECAMERNIERMKSWRHNRRGKLPAIPCEACGTSFLPTIRTEKHCPTCVEKRRYCAVCGVKKKSYGPRCKKCDELNSIGRPNLKNRREEKPIEQVIAEVEAFGLLPKKQYAFGYVMGVIFGDGYVSKTTRRPSHIRSDGTRATKRSTVYLIRLSVTSQRFAERFANHLAMLIERTVKIRTVTRTNFSKSTLKGKRDEYSVQLFNIDQCHILLGRYLAHLKYEQDVYELLRFPREVMRGFVHGMIDSEGYVKGRRIDIANKKVTLLDVLALMLELLGYKATVYTYPSNPTSHLKTYMTYNKYGL